MNTVEIPIRRSILAAALLGWIALTLSGCGMAPAQSEAETANIKVVDDFIASWDDPDKAASYLSANASVRMVEDQPAVIGPAAVAAAFKSFMTPAMELTVDTLSTTAHGPVVLNKRIDVLKTPGQPDQVFPVVGVFVVKKGKIEEWTDYLDQ